MPSRRAIPPGRASHHGQPPDFAGVDLWLPALVDAARFGGAHPPTAARAANWFRIRRTRRACRGTLADRGAGVEPGCSLAFSATRLPFGLVDDVLQVLKRTRQAVDAGDHQRVAARRKSSSTCNSLRPPRRAPLALFGTDHLVASRLQRSTLNRQVLIEGGAA